jgi:predicted HTH domain antitoxin
MAISIDLTADFEQSLQRQVENLDRAAKESLLVDLYRQHKITEAQLSKAMGLSRVEVEGLLKQHEVFLEQSVEDVARESRELSRLRGGVHPVGVSSSVGRPTP